MPSVESLSFELALEQLEAAVRELEGGDLGLDAALAKYERGVQLLARCHGLLEQAERKVELLVRVDEEGRPVTRPFDESATMEQRSGSRGGTASAGSEG